MSNVEIFKAAEKTFVSTAAAKALMVKKGREIGSGKVVEIVDALIADWKATPAIKYCNPGFYGDRIHTDPSSFAAYINSLINA